MQKPSIDHLNATDRSNLRGEIYRARSLQTNYDSEEIPVAKWSRAPHLFHRTDGWAIIVQLGNGSGGESTSSATSCGGN
eukprot:758184-Hanusia_phi.AAC.10